MANNLYNEKSIESLDPLSFTRLKPGVYCGDTSNPNQLLVEIISNAIDEFRLGHGNKIEVSLRGDRVRVRDYGQGFIVNSLRDDGKTVLEAAFSVLNTSGKYRQDGTYEGTSLGSFGIGSKITTYLSHWLDVRTFRDGKSEFIHFKEGVFDYREVESSSEPTGTIVEWLPSEEFFGTTYIDVGPIKTLLKTLSCLCPGLTIIFDKDGIVDEYTSPNGLNDLVDDVVKDTEIIDNRFCLNWQEDKYKIDLVLTYTSSYAFTVVPYVNTGLTETGFHITQMKGLLTREFNKFAKDKGWLKDKDDNLNGEDIQEGMYMVFNLTAPDVAYDAQVKSRITKIEMKPFIQPFIDSFEVWLNSNEKDMKIIVDKALQARKAREAAKKARDDARNNQKKKEKVLKFDSKLADCYGKNRTKCELYVTEGDSASGNLKTARNNELQAVMPIRGKMLNAQTASLSQIQKNQEIMTLIDALGLTLDSKTMKATYEPEDLRYDKIIIMSDADVDGAHIKNLFYTFVWNICPKLIEEGHIYAGVPPLYKVTIGKEYKYLKNDEALEQFKSDNSSRKMIVNRMKGLGEMSVDETAETLTDIDNRIIKQISIDDTLETAKLFESLMGSGVEARKEYVKNHSTEATYNQE